ncbi:hypothetical protein SHELI_v1c10490 [Spiroplasma helicoides]|uniref:Uncharacterized protein n=1 Tax=Spiroplasma helicoides TaxID=216938 RepID=A0A1B3SM34_9MOLU|nr:hypothetical protein [Spiroplasma helicoides]AOG60996.1 hypothetical protein SHELI_v1c10490 [Spiroplasma helicoides]
MDKLQKLIFLLLKDEQKLAKELAKSFSFNYNNKMFYYELIQDSVISFAKSLNILTGENYYIKDFNTASETIAKIVKNLINNNLEIKWFEKMHEWLPGLIEFFKVVINYFNIFDVNKIIDEILTIDDVLEVRKKNIKNINLNYFDANNFLLVLKSIVNNHNNKGENILKNILNIFFSTHNIHGYKGKDEVDIKGGKLKIEYESISEVYAKILVDILIELMGENTIEFSLVFKKYKIYTKNLLKALINWVIGYNSGGSLLNFFDIPKILHNMPKFRKYLPPFLQGLINKVKINSKEWEKFTDNFISYIWLDEKNLIGINLKNLLEESIFLLIQKIINLEKLIINKKSFNYNNSLNIIDLKTYFFSKSVKEIINICFIKTHNKRNNLVNFNLVESLFLSFIDLKFLNINEKNLWLLLGVKQDFTVEFNSPMYYFKELLASNIDFISSWFNILQTTIDDLNSCLKPFNKIYNLKLNFERADNSDIYIKYLSNKIIFSIKLFELDENNSYKKICIKFF